MTISPSCCICNNNDEEELEWHEFVEKTTLSHDIKNNSNYYIVTTLDRPVNYNSFKDSDEILNYWKYKKSLKDSLRSQKNNSQASRLNLTNYGCECKSINIHDSIQKNNNNFGNLFS